MLDIQELEPNVHRLVNLDSNGVATKELILIGTAHVSRTSAELVTRIINDRKPQSVAIELCPSRFDSISDPDRWQNTNIFQVIKSGKAYLLLTQLLLASFQKRVADRFGIRPGEEMLAAIDSAKTLGSEIDLIDRDVRTTLKRAWASASPWSMLKLVWAMIASMISGDDLTERQIEELKSGDALASIVSEFSEVLPGVKVALIDERDKYMGAKLYSLQSTFIVAVVGAGHVPGILKSYGQKVDLADLESIPPPNRYLTILGLLFPLAIVLSIVWGFFNSGFETGTEMISSWVKSTGVFSAIGAALGLAHPLSILTAFVAAPFTTLHPLLAAGWFAGLVEALLRKPRVLDLENLASEVTSIKGFYKNRVSRVLLVMALCNLGAALGSVIGALNIFYRL